MGTSFRGAEEYFQAPPSEQNRRQIRKEYSADHFTVAYSEGGAVIPKSARKERMEENLNIWDFALDSKDMDAIATMDIGHSEIINHYSACTAKALNAAKI